MGPFRVLEGLALDYKLLLRSIMKNILLFIIAMVLVVGFWYHGYFYSLGLETLIIVGGIIVFAVLKLGSWINSHRFFQIYDGVLLFDSKDVEKVKNGAIRGVIRRYRSSRTIRRGNIIRAKLNLASEQFFAELHVVGVTIKKLGEITDEDAYICGYQDKKEFREKWTEEHGGFNEEEEVRFIRFNVI